MGKDRGPCLLDCGQAAIGADPKHPIQHFIDALAVPLRVHIRFAHAERAACQSSLEEVRIVDADIPGIRPIDTDAGTAEQRFDGRTIASGHGVWRGALFIPPMRRIALTEPIFKTLDCLKSIRGIDHPGRLAGKPQGTADQNALGRRTTLEQAQSPAARLPDRGMGSAE